MGTRCRLAGASAVLVAMLATGTATAQPRATPAEVRRARAEFERGRTAFEAGQFDAALRSFETSYLITGSVEILYNIAVCHDRLRHDAEALGAYRNYLTQVPNAADRANIEARIAALEEAEAARVEGERVDREPAEVATPAPAAASAGANDRVPRDRAPDAGGSVFGEWWFWTGVVAVVALGVIAGIVLFGGGEAPFVEGDDGHVHSTLRFEGP